VRSIIEEILGAGDRDVNAGEFIDTAWSTAQIQRAWPEIKRRALDIANSEHPDVHDIDTVLGMIHAPVDGRYWFNRATMHPGKLPGTAADKAFYPHDSVTVKNCQRMILLDIQHLDKNVANGDATQFTDTGLNDPEIATGLLRRYLMALKTCVENTGGTQDK
jgi:hypothetical protein